jgi:NAD(P)-dependent dehydrogenase (short-subunit alcohol dehydrogenase family)
MNGNPVLVTGCSSGIGKATAQALVRAGHTVYATARRPSTLTDLEDAGARTLALDVTDEESRTAAVRAIEAEHGSVGTLVNNAGYGVYGPVEEVAMDDVRREFETNVFGLGRLTQLVLPAMRAAGRGRIVNMSSMGGPLVYPTGPGTRPAPMPPCASTPRRSRDAATPRASAPTRRPSPTW